MPRPPWLSLVLLLLAAAPARSTPPEGTALNPPGLFFALAADSEAPGPDTPFPIASLTKTYVAALGLRMTADPRLGLSLDEPAARWLPELAADYPQLAQTTPRDLLQHRSGFFDYTELPAFAWNPGWSSDEALRAALEHRPYAPPGQGLRYANTNYLLAGKILEAAGGENLDGLLRRYVCAPLKLEGTFFPGSAATQTPWPRAADAGLFSSARDLNRLLHALFAEEGFLSREQRKAMRHFVVANKAATGYGLGLMRDTAAVPRSWWHTGVIPGYRSAFFWFPDRRRSLIVFAARSDPDAEHFIEASMAEAQCAFGLSDACRRPRD